MENPTKIKLNKYDLNNAGSKRYLNKYLFTQIADKYNLAAKILSFGRDHSWKKKLIKMIPYKDNAGCLDIACGTGDITMLLAKKFKNASIIGIDLNDKMLQIAKERVEFINVDFKERDMIETGLNADIFDVITGGYALRNAPDIKKVLDEIYRILKTGGFAYFLDFSKSSNFVLQFIQLFLLKFWGSFCGIILHGNPDVYAYIAKSLKHFPDNKKLLQMLKDTGFINIKFKFLFFGFLYILRFEK